MAPSDWSWSAEALAPVALAAVYVTVVARRGEATWWRVLAFCGGCVLLVLALVSPLDTLAREYLVWAHLLQNVVLAEWAPLLLVVGIPTALGAALTRGRVLHALTHPFVALPLWVGTYALWHVPVLYDAALDRPQSLLLLEHLTYLAAGVLLWWCVWQDAPHHVSPGGRAGYVFAAFLLSAPLGLLLALLPEPIYEAYADAPERVWGLDRTLDQQLGGMTMAAEQSVVFFAVFALWFVRFLAAEDRHDRDPVNGAGTHAPRA
ncbi:MAG: cytochrome c oxidase assembly protein [Gaiella sp.]